MTSLYGEQTRLAVANFAISGVAMPQSFISALARVKRACALVNRDNASLDAKIADAIVAVADKIAAGEYVDQFPVDVFQTGSGTSTNMNMNEVIANLASELAGVQVHPNDHVNKSQSSNDIIPTSIQVSCSVDLAHKLLPAMASLLAALADKAATNRQVKNGRTHLMDAMPVRFDQELMTWHDQLANCQQRLSETLQRLNALPQGGTAVGTGINAPADFGTQVAKALSADTKLPFTSMANKFVGISSQDTSLELSAGLKGVAVVLLKIANDLRWMNSGPLAGLAEIELPALQAGSSIMPGKVNPVIPEAVAMVAAQVIGNDTSVTIAAQSGNFQLNVMLPVIAHNLLFSIDILANAMTSLGAQGDHALYCQ